MGGSIKGGLGGRGGGEDKPHAADVAGGAVEGGAEVEGCWIP